LSPACRPGPTPRIITNRLHGDLLAIVNAALRACDARTLLSRALDRHPLSDTETFNVVAAGKAAQPMADAFAARFGTRTREVVVARGGHPLPDAASFAAGAAALRLADENRARGERLVVLLSGGASAMLAAPAPGVTLEDKIALTRALLRSGLAIADLNAIRKHVSAIKGGQLAVAAGRSITYAISDVHAPIEDDPAVIGSGPTVPDPSTFAAALSALSGLTPLLFSGAAIGAQDPESEARRPNSALTPEPPTSPHRGLTRIVERLQRGVRGEIAETPKSGHPRLADAPFVVAGSRRDAMDGAAAEARQLGYAVEVIATPTLGEARDAARTFFASAPVASALHSGSVAAFRRKVCIIASGETTVTLGASQGAGGRNQEFALAGALAMARIEGVALASVGTDGIDGPTNAAGAIADGTTIPRAHDSHPFFKALGDLVVTGPTGTNVGDLQVFISESLR
jgi:glycerate 2-kinase